jgi:hypothetical protein
MISGACSSARLERRSDTAEAKGSIPFKHTTLMGRYIDNAERIYEMGKPYPVVYIDQDTGLQATPDDFSIGIWYTFGDTEMEEEAHCLTVPTFEIDILGIINHELPRNWRVSG